MDIEVAMNSDTTITCDQMKSAIEKEIRTKNIHSIDDDGVNTKQIFQQIIKLPSEEYDEAIEDVKIYINNLNSVKIHCFFMNHEDSIDSIIDNEGEVLSIAKQTTLPSEKFQNDWDSVVFDTEKNDIKSMLINYMETSVVFNYNDVCSDIVTSNKIILLYGPPGTGKTTICHGLAQKITIRFSHLFQYGIILEVNTHSLFSKWFAESGKMVKKLFDRLNSISSDQNILVFVLIDEVESLATARNSAMNGSDPSDAIRVVNALLTQIDQLRKKTNVIILATSNLTDCIDFAFLSRADIKQYIGPPSRMARYIILKSCIDELYNKGLIESNCGILDFKQLSIFQEEIIQANFINTSLLLKVVDKCDGLSGRVLRRLPFLAFVYKTLEIPAKYPDFIEAIIYAISQQFEQQN